MKLPFLLATAVPLRLARSQDPSPSPTAIATSHAGGDGGMSMANPASVNCQSQGGTSKNRYDKDGGQYGLCVFDDGSACEEWALFSGDCEVGSTPIFSSYCADSGGTLTNSTVDWGDVEGAPSADYEMCTFEDGSECAEYSYYSKGCDGESIDLIGMGDPSAVYCEDNGGTVETLTQEDGGEYGLCIFDDGTACDTWAYYRDECIKGSMPIFSTFCADSSGKTENRADVLGEVHDGAPLAEVEVCVFPDGSVCTAHAYYDEGGCDKSETPVSTEGAPPNGSYPFEVTSLVLCIELAGLFLLH